MELETRPLQENFGLEVLNVDLEHMDAETFAAVYKLWQRDPLLLFRRQSVTERRLVDYSKGFGKLERITRDDMYSPTYPEVIYITGMKRPDGRALGGLGVYELHWHHDQIYRLWPATGSIFYATEMPEGAGSTWWCNTALGYASLPDDLKAEIDGKTATAKFGHNSKRSFQRDFSEDKDRVKVLHDRTPPATHPIVLTHPVTGEKSTFLDPNKTITIEGKSEEETQALLERLFAHIVRDDHIYAHDWRNGDVVMWDNGRLMHRRDGYDPNLPRFAKRTTVFLKPDDFAVPQPEASDHAPA